MTTLDPLARLVVGILNRTLPAEAADDVIGDLVEQYVRRPRFRRLWLLTQAFDLLWGFGTTRQRSPRPSSGVRLDVLLQDLRYALRSLFRSRGFAAVALLSLALGVGLATAVFSVVDGVLLRPLPYGDAERIVRIRQITTGRAVQDDVPRWVLGPWVDNPRTLSALTPYSMLEARLRTEAESFAAIKTEVGEQFFEVLRTVPLHGRLLTRADLDRGAPQVAVLGHAFWRAAYGGQPSAIGRLLLIDDRPFEIVGVLPDTFAYPSLQVAAFVPGRWRLPETAPGVPSAFMGPRIEVIGRMRPGMRTADVAHEATTLLQRGLRPGSQPAPALFEAVRLQDDLAKDAKPALVVLMASVACVLAIVCVNLTNLLLARGTVRQREIGVRAALGASRWRMTRPLAFEGALLSLMGGGAGIAVASALLASMPLAASLDPMLAAQVRIDDRVLGFALGVSSLIGVIVGALPAWQASDRSVTAALSNAHVQLLPGATVRAERVRSGLVVVQVALAIVLAVGAALLSRSLVRLLTVDLGFRPEGALSLEVKLPPRGGSSYGWRARFYEDFVAAVSAHPGVVAAGFSTSLPAQESFAISAIRIDGVPPPQPDVPLRAHREVVTPGYFRALGLPVVAGRGLLATDTASSERVLIVNATFGETFLTGRDPVGHRVMVFGDWHRIVGVVKAKRHAGLRSEQRPELYVALAQSPPDVASMPSAGLVVRTAGAPLGIVPFVRSTLKSLQPDAAIEREAALEDRIWSSTARPRFYASVMGVFAVLAVTTAIVGLFGVLTYVVERRRREIGVRRALGASRSDIYGLVVGRGLTLIALAIPLGALGASAGARLLGNLLFGIEPADPFAFFAVLVIVPAVAIAACLWPAHRAARIEPLDALREE